MDIFYYVIIDNFDKPFLLTMILMWEVQQEQTLYSNTQWRILDKFLGDPKFFPVYNKR